MTIMMQRRKMFSVIENSRINQKYIGRASATLGSRGRSRIEVRLTCHSHQKPMASAHLFLRQIRSLFLPYN